MLPRVLIAAVLCVALLTVRAGRAEWRILTFEAEDDFDRLGTTAAAPGDVNGDGWPDLFVGAGVSDAAAVDAGRAYVYYGGPEADAYPDLIFTGEAYQDRFAFWVGAPGDVNGDGYADMLTGAPYQDLGGEDAGAAYLFLGGPDADNAWDLKATGENPGDQFGFATCGAGDFNADGYKDWIVGAFLHDARSVETGRAYVFYGGPEPDGEPDLVLEGEEPLDRFGSAVSGVGDLDGDGYDDVVVGAYQSSLGGYQSGAVYVFRGGPDPDATPDWVIPGRDEGDQLGLAAVGAGDLNDDGYNDLAVGAILADDGVLFGGAAYVLFGGPDFDTSIDLVLKGETAFDQFGNALAGLGDVNGDGLDDLLVGARDADFRGPQSGRAYVFHGGPRMDDVPDLILDGDSENDRFGYALAGPGDVDGDGRADLLIGARMSDALHEDAGRAYVIAAAEYHLREPDGGEVWHVGDKARVRWSGRSVADVDLSLDGGWSWTTIAHAVGGGDDNAITMTVPDTLTDTALIRVRTSGDDPAGVNEDGSDAVFRIAMPPAGGELEAWPSPSPGGDVTIGFRSAGWLGSSDAAVELAVYDLAGRRVRTIVDEAVPTGYQTANWNGRDAGGRPVASGTYLLRLSTGGWNLERRIVIRK